jgi:hypothetical protein
MTTTELNLRSAAIHLLTVLLQEKTSLKVTIAAAELLSAVKESQEKEEKENKS